MRTAVLRCGSVNRACPTGARRRRIAVDGLGSAEGVCLFAISNSTFAASNILLRILGRGRRSFVAVEFKLVYGNGRPLGNRILGIGARETRNVQTEEAPLCRRAKRNLVGKRRRTIVGRMDVLPIAAIGCGRRVARRILNLIAGRLIRLPFDRRFLYGLGRPQVNVDPMGAAGSIFCTTPARRVIAVNCLAGSNRRRLFTIRHCGFIEGEIGHFCCCGRTHAEQQRRKHDRKHACDHGDCSVQHFGLLYRHAHVPFLSYVSLNH